MKFGKDKVTSYFHPYYSKPSIQTHWKQYIRDGIIITAVATALIAVLNVSAATFNFTQSSWAGGVSTATSTHTNNQTNWTQFSATSTGMTVGTTVALAGISYAFTDDGTISSVPVSSATGGTFGAGTNASTTVTGTGTGASVSLATTSYTRISSGQAHTLAIRSDGTLWAWGTNSDGRLGDGTLTGTSTPKQIGTATYTAVAGGQYHSLAIHSNGTLWGWGWNSNGQVGDGTVTQRNSPVQIGSATYTAVSTGADYSLAIHTNGTLWAWGLNSDGQLGDGTLTQRNSPVQIGTATYTAVTGGRAHTLAIRTNGTLWAWGAGAFGGLGDGTTVSKSNPTAIGTATYTAVAGGSGHSLAIHTNGTLWAWGHNNYGQVGDGSTTNRTSPLQIGTATHIAVSAGNVLFSHAIRTNNTLWGWGDNASGKLGDGTITDRLVPTAIGSATYTAVTSGESFALAIHTNGILWAWGAGYTTSPTTSIVNNASYLTPGLFTSAVINLGTPVSFTTLSFTTTLNSQTITIDARAGNTATPDGTWTAWQTGIASGGSISGLAGNRYIQYRANLSTTNALATPTLNSLTINYTQFNTTGNLTSSAYDTTASTNIPAGISWTATGTSASETVALQVRSSANGSTWTNWCGATLCDNTNTFTTSSTSNIGSTHPLRTDGIGDRFIQYRVLLASGGTLTPTVTGVTMTYVVNAPPNFDPTYGTNGITVSQGSNGLVTIAYSIRDIDTTTGNINPGFVTPSFEYSINGGTSFTAIPGVNLATGNTSNKAVENTNYTIHTATWSATSTVPNIDITNAQVRVTINDNDAANNIAVATSTNFIIDTILPVISPGRVILDSSTGGVGVGTITITITDTSTTQYRLCNNSTFTTPDAQGNSCAYSVLGTNASTTITNWVFTGAPGAETVHLQVRDAYGNTISQTRNVPAMLTNYIFSDVTNLNTPSYRTYLDWTSVSATGFGSYQVFNATTTVGAAVPIAGAYVRVATITDVTTSFYTHQIPASDKDFMQYYRVRMANADGDISDFTAVLNDVPNGIGGSATGGGTTTLAPGTDPAAATVGPAAGATDVNIFTMVKNVSTDTVTSVVVNLSTNIGVGTLAITDALNNVLGSTTTVATGANTIIVSGMHIGTATSSFKIRVTPLAHSLMPAAPGASYIIIATVMSWLDSATTRTGSDSNTNALTIDNTSPSNVTAATTTRKR